MDVKRSDPEAFQKLELKLKQLQGYTAKVGWFENAKEEDGTSSAAAAAYNEFGHGKVPPRLGMRGVVKAQSAAWRDFARGASKRIMDGNWTARDAMEALGNQGHKDIYKRINSNPGPPLSELTLALRKRREDGKLINGRVIGEIYAKLKAGESVPLSRNTQTLVDTSRMLNNLSVLVEKV